ncbi:MAG: DMT family transporter [Proteobacteria bacterium]|nr:DMT family transporter [Pseudomonadota bacterium]
MSSNYLGILFSLSAYFFLVMMDSYAKYLSDYLQIQEIVWGRYFFHLLLTLLIIFTFKIKVNLKKNFNFQILRSLLMIISTILMYLSLKFLNITDVYVIFFLSPFFLVLFSQFYLNDRMSFKGKILMLLSFLSVLFALEIFNKNINIYFIIPLMMALTFALYQFLTKKIAKNNEPFTDLFYSGVLGGTLLTIVIFLDGNVLSFSYLPQLILLGTLGLVSHLLLILAIKFSNLSLVSNIQYSQLIWANISNVFFFNQELNSFMIMGSILIIIFGYLFLKLEFRTNE